MAKGVIKRFGPDSCVVQCSSSEQISYISLYRTVTKIAGLIVRDKKDQ